ncbi:tripartite tricarboxylate transporter substrate binding protein [Hydrogenophaga sp. 2FB]|uniref:Bug family tripartite tricarboxylate transporter substrate binding protein n=1 Tax=Hydrogenophaga sp. 2FB TaxID=2502187 RepID=UPI0010F6D417|nr:tripartite tricarboxylate transporter substrate binding protein [Hydrogenophaga sp. 2FB]
MFHTTFMSRRCAVQTLGGLVAAAIHPLASAQAYPARPIRIIVPVGAGGATDTVARAFANELPKVLGGAVIVENKPGAAGVIGTMAVKQSVADGYTLLLGTIGTHSTNPYLLARVPYDARKDFMPISLLTKVSNVVIVPKDFPARTLQEFVAYARKHPGKLNYAVGTTGSSSHLAVEMLKQRAGLDMARITYKGPAEASTDLVAGRVQLMFSPVMIEMANIQSGRVRALAQTASRRVSILPDVPTVAEAGFPGFEASGWNGLFAPAGTPAAIVDQLSAAVRQVAAKPELQKIFTGQGVEVATNTPPEFSSFLDADRKQWESVITAAGIKPE